MTFLVPFLLLELVPQLPSCQRRLQLRQQEHQKDRHVVVVKNEAISASLTITPSMAVFSRLEGVPRGTPELGLLSFTLPLAAHERHHVPPSSQQSAGQPSFLRQTGHKGQDYLACLLHYLLAPEPRRSSSQ